jgi:hypothetical protein
MQGKGGVKSMHSIVLPIYTIEKYVFRNFMGEILFTQFNTVRNRKGFFCLAIKYCADA